MSKEFAVDPSCALDFCKSHSEGCWNLVEISEVGIMLQENGAVHAMLVAHTLVRSHLARCCSFSASCPPTHPKHILLFFFCALSTHPQLPSSQHSHSAKCLFRS
jgi:hypothetical protein